MDERRPLIEKQFWSWKLRTNSESMDGNCLPLQIIEKNIFKKPILLWQNLNKSFEEAPKLYYCPKTSKKSTTDWRNLGTY